MRFRTLGLLVLAGLAAAAPAAAQKVDPKALDTKYQHWLDLVTYHIQPVEKEVFLQLQNDRDRDLFIETFWKQRDPTPGTPQNEYKEELEKRFAYCNEFYGRSTTRAGWKTDMGRVHMILGPPISVEHFEATIGVVPCYAWTYYGDARRNLPPNFVLLFYQRGGVGEYKLYDPVTDGPTRLLQNQKDLGDPFDYATLYDKIQEVSPTLAELSITRIPGEYNPDLSPSPRNALLLADIFDAPKKDVNPSYATHFLNYKGLVSTEYLTNYVESYSQTTLVEDPATGLRFLHLSMVPTDIKVDFYEPKSQFYCDYQINVSLRQGDNIIFQYNREYPLYFPEDQWNLVKASGLAIEESFPVAEGTYDLNVLLTNTVGKQFSLLEEPLVVPPIPAKPSIEGLLVGYRIETYPRDVHIPFKVLDKKVVLDPRLTFSSTDPIAILLGVRRANEGPARGGEVRIEARGQRQANPVRRTYTVKLDPAEADPLTVVAFTIPPGDLDPDYYEITASLVGTAGEVLDEKRQPATISPAKVIGHPIAKAKGIPLANAFLFRYMLGEQLEKTGRTAEARAYYDEAYQLRPDYLDGVVRYANFLNKSGAFDQALKVAEELRKDDRRKFVLHLIRGQALYGLAKYEEALDDYSQANRAYNSDTAVLNGLGRCYEKLGRKADAVDAFKASLKLNADQPEIKKLIDDLTRSK